MSFGQVQFFIYRFSEIFPFNFPLFSYIASRFKIAYDNAMREKNELNAVVEMLTQWVTAVKLRNAVNYTDINRTAENLVLRLLNTAYDYNLKNLNWDQNNYPAVDLGDQNRGIAFQVTASGDLKKIKDTVEKFYAIGGPHKEFSNGLYFFFIKEKTPTLSAETKRKLKTKYGLDADRQMLSIKKLLMRIEELYSTDRQRFLWVKDLLEEEWGYGTGKINRRQVLEELYRGSTRYLASLRGGGGRFRYLKISDILLAPTRKNQRKEWLDTQVSVDGKADEFPDDERVSSNVLGAIPQLWQEACRHAMLKGEGGMGKTVSFIRLWEQYTAGDEYNPLLPVTVFIPLNEYNETEGSEKKGFIQRLIRRFYLDDKTQNLDLLNVFREQVKGEKRGVPSVILLLDGIVERYLKRFCQLDFLRTFREYRKHTTAWSIDGCESNKVFGKVESVLDILSDEMSMLVKEGKSYRFLHQDFRDFFAAVHILNEVVMGLSGEEVAEVLTCGMISLYPQRYMGGIEGEHYCKPYLEEGKGWQIKSNESTLLAQALEKCRGHFTEPYAHAVSNILHSWKEVRGEWSGLDLSRLDLSNVFINGRYAASYVTNHTLPFGLMNPLSK